MPMLDYRFGAMSLNDFLKAVRYNEEAVRRGMVMLDGAGTYDEAERFANRLIEDEDAEVPERGKLLLEALVKMKAAV